MAKNGRSPDAPPPAFQFYPGDFLSDENVAAMTLEERGAYITLLCHAWKEGSIPADVEQIGRLLHLDGTATSQLWLAIGKCWKEGPETRLKQPRMERERSYMRARSEERRAAGLKGSVARWPNGSSATRQLLANDSTTTPTPTYNPHKPPKGGVAWKPKNEQTDRVCQYLDKAIRWHHARSTNKPTALRGRKAVDGLLGGGVSPDRARDVINHIFGSESSEPSSTDYDPQDGFNWKNIVTSSSKFAKHWNALDLLYAAAVNGRAVS